MDHACGVYVKPLLGLSQHSLDGFFGHARVMLQFHRTDRGADERGMAGGGALAGPAAHADVESGVGLTQVYGERYCGTIFTKPSYFQTPPTRSQRSQKV